MATVEIAALRIRYARNDMGVVPGERAIVVPRSFEIVKEGIPSRLEKAEQDKIPLLFSIKSKGFVVRPFKVVQWLGTRLKPRTTNLAGQDKTPLLF